jgi:predicted secreted Zn-dependent protease
MLLASTRPSLPRGVVVTDDTTRYEITGSTSAEIGHELKAAHTATGGVPFVGMTSPQISWQISIRHVVTHSAGRADSMASRVNDRCDVVGVVVSVEVRTVLPLWKRPVGASSTLASQWAAFMEATSRHENGHRNIALNTAAAIARTLEGDRGLPCEGLENLADASARAQWDLGNQHQLIYDEATDNGSTQGTRWPPVAPQAEAGVPSPGSLQ